MFNKFVSKQYIAQSIDNVSAKSFMYTFLAYGGSVVLLRFPLLSEIMHRGAPVLVCNQYSWKVNI
jgi:hypothetical protein